MTYEQVVSWCKANVPMGQATDFNDWLRMCEQEFLNAGHFLPHQVESMLEKAWNKEHPKTSSGQDEQLQRDLADFNRQEQEHEIIHAKLERRIDRFPQDLEFTPKQIASFTGQNKNTIRRELQEFVAEGKLQRVSRGRYRLAP